MANFFPITGKITFTEPISIRKPEHSSSGPAWIIQKGIAAEPICARQSRRRHPSERHLIPQRAVQQSAKGAYVWVVNKEDKADFRPVTVGDWQGEDWFISDGLKSGEQMVVDGGMALHKESTASKLLH